MTERPLDPRAAALRFLLEARRGVDPDARRRAAAALPPRDRGLFVELVAGVTRERLLYDAVIAAYARGPLERIEPRLLQALRIGLHQLLRLERMPPHAAVASALALLPARRARGFANAILRGLLREGRFVAAAEAGAAAPRRLIELGPDRFFLAGRDLLPDPEEAPLEHLALRFGFAPEAAGLLVDELGRDAAERLMAAARVVPALVLRADRTRIAPAALAARLEEEGFAVAAPEPGSDLLRLRGGDPAAGAAFAEGLFSIQGPFAARVAPLLDPRPGERILDLCAPPGGKTVHLAELAPEARIVAFARDPAGRLRLEQNLARARRPNVEILTDEAQVAAGSFAAILLDVPCSNSGVLSRRPEARERLTRKNLESLRRVQEELLARALAVLRPGDRLVYATCSVLPSENEELVRRLLEARPGAVLAAEIRSFPDEAGGDGGYAARVELRFGDGQPIP